MKHIKTLKAYEQAINTNEYTVMIYYSDWCSDCHFMDTYLPKLEEAFPNFTFYKVDREQVKSLSIHLNIYGVPSLLFYHKDKIVKSFIDKNRKSFIEVTAFLEQCQNEMERR